MSFSDLFRPKWQSSDPNIRFEGVQRLRNDAVLVQLARTDPDPLVRWAAVWQISDRDLVADLAAKAEFEDTRNTAARKLQGPGKEVQIRVGSELDAILGRGKGGLYVPTAIVVKEVRCNGKSIRVTGKYRVKDGKATVHSQLIGDFPIVICGEDTDYQFSGEQLAKIITLP